MKIRVSSVPIELLAVAFPGLRVDYFCDGVDDDIEIQAAIDAANQCQAKVELIGLFNVSKVPRIWEGVRVVGFEPEIRRIWGGHVPIHTSPGPVNRVWRSGDITLKIDIGQYGWVPGYVPLGKSPVLGIYQGNLLLHELHNGGDHWECTFSGEELEEGKQKWEIGVNHGNWLVIARGTFSVKDDIGKGFLKRTFWKG